MSEWRWCILFLGILPAAISDALTLRVNAWWLFSCSVIVTLINCLCKSTLMTLGLSFFPAVLVWVLARLSKGIGMGDVLAVCYIGAVCGWVMSMEILFAGSLICFLVQLMMRIYAKLQIRYGEKQLFKAQEIKKEAAFVPYLLVAAFIYFSAENLV